MKKINLDGKIIPVLCNYSYSYIYEEKIDNDTGQIVFPYYRFNYHIIVDKLFNVYILPMRDDKVLYELTDIVLAACGRKENIDLIETANNSIEDEAGFIIITDYNFDLLYCEYIVNDQNCTTKEYITNQLKQRIKGEINIPNHVTMYYELVKDQKKLEAILATAIYKDVDKVESTSCTDRYIRLPRL